MLGDHGRQPSAAIYAQFVEHVAEMEFDRLCTEKQQARDFSIGMPASNGKSDLKLLGREHRKTSGRRLWYPNARGLQFAACPVCPVWSPQPLKTRQRGVEPRSSIAGLVVTPEMLANH